MRDERSYRVALVADRYVNPEPGQLDGLAVLAAAGWGVIPAWLRFHPRR